MNTAAMLVAAFVLAHGDHLAIEDGGGGPGPAHAFNFKFAPMALDSPTDAVLLDVREIKKGEPAPDDGIWADSNSAMALANKERQCKEDLGNCRLALGSATTGTKWIIIAVTVVAAFAGGYAVAKLAK